MPDSPGRPRSGLCQSRSAKRLSEQAIAAGASCSTRRRSVWRLCRTPKFPCPGCGVDLGNQRADGSFEDQDFRMRGETDSVKQCLDSFGCRVVDPQASEPETGIGECKGRM